MNKILFLMVISFSSVFAGWFTTATSETREIDGKEVRISTKIDFPNNVTFSDSFIADVTKNRYEQLRERGNKLFGLIVEHGKAKGYKSFSLQAKYLSPETGFIFDNTEDIVKYCTLGKEYTNFCSAGNDGIIFNNSTKYAIKVIFYPDNSGAISF